MDYFYCLPDHISDKTVVIDGEEFSHLVHVMRKIEGDEIRVVDGLGNAYDVVLESIRNKTAHGSIKKLLPHHQEPMCRLTLAVGILKNPSKFDFLVEKATELGVHEIVPMLTDRTIPSHAKIDRWQKLAIAGMKQSNRSYLPMVRELVSFRELLDDPRPFDRRFIAHEKAADPLPPSADQPASVLLFIGPEGGFSDEEFARAVAAGITPIGLGARRLRTETAAIVATAFILR